LVELCDSQSHETEEMAMSSIGHKSKAESTQYISVGRGDILNIVAHQNVLTVRGHCH
jgi:hypothetical protein